MPRTFIETFDQPRRGWLEYPAGVECRAVPVENGAAVSRSPWWVDYNHAPPGGGYLHILFGLHTYHHPGWQAQFDPVFGPNPFVLGQFPTDFRNARVTCRLKGQLTPRGSSLVLLAQGKLRSNDRWVNQVLTAQPFPITPDWSDQTITLVPDQKQWTQLGSRHDRTATYATGPIEELLADLNGDFLLVLFSLDIRPLHPVPGDMHKLRAGIPATAEAGGFDIDRACLPEGEIHLDTFRIDFNV